MTNEIEVLGVSKVFPGDRTQSIVALEDINLTIPKGEFVTIIGPSGCGKSTLLRMMAGLENPTRGSIQIREREIRGPSTEVGLMFQDPVLLPWRTLLDNVLLPAEIRRLNKDLKSRAVNLLDLTNLTEFSHHYPRDLSGGMRQRAALCRTLLLDPSVLLMDEPFGALDAMTRESLNKELYDLWRQSGQTIVFITHDIGEAVRLSSQVVVMSARPGKVHANLAIDLEDLDYIDRITSSEFAELAAELYDIVYTRRWGKPSSQKAPGRQHRS